MSSAGAASRAAVPISSARAEASRRNGAKSRGPKTPEGKARSAQNALKHGMRAQKYVVLPEEDAGEFAALEAALTLELAPQGVLQSILVGRIARAAWRLERAERIEVDLFAERLRSIRDGGVGLALIRDGNSTRSFETVLRYRGAALAEFMRSLRMLKALQAGQGIETAPALAARPKRPAARPPVADRPQPSEPERGAEPRLQCVLPDPPAHLCTSPLGGRADPAQSTCQTDPNVIRTEDPKGQRRDSPKRTARARPHRPARNARHGVPGSHGPTEQMPNEWLTSH